MTSLRRFVPLIALLFVTSCSSSPIISTWKKPEVATISFQRVVVIAAARDAAKRREVEERLVRKLKGRGVASYTLSPEAPVDDELHALIQQRKFDGAVVVRIVSSENDWTGPYYGSEQPTQVDTSVRMETNVYELPSETLIWAASSRTVKQMNLKDLVDETIEVVSKEFQKQGMISPVPVVAR